MSSTPAQPTPKPPLLDAQRVLQLGRETLAIEASAVEQLQQRL
ncbi:MAG: hypothetical protein RLZZ24_1959, partial [Pseudomonadota bacterium]